MKNKGFSLIELLVVIAILGTLTAIVIIAVNPVQLLRNARDTRRKQDITRIAEAIEAYYAANGFYPREVDGMDSSIGFAPSCAHDGPLPYQAGQFHDLTDPGHSNCVDIFNNPRNGWDPASPFIKDALAPYIASLPKDPINNATWHYWYNPQPTPDETGCGYDPTDPVHYCPNIQCGDTAAGQPTCQEYKIAAHLEAPILPTYTFSDGSVASPSGYTFSCGNTHGTFDKAECQQAHDQFEPR